MALSENVAREIRAEMARQRIGQKKLAAACGWPQNYLQRRLGPRPELISLDDLAVIAGWLQVPLVSLLGPDAMHTVNPDEWERTDSE